MKKKYLHELKLEIIYHEEYENYWDIKEHKECKDTIIIGQEKQI
jgi:hypothetical protein